MSLEYLARRVAVFWLDPETEFDVLAGCTF